MAVPVVLISFALFTAACSSGDEATLSDGELAATASGFVIEPAAEVGPDAFTPPVDTAPLGDDASGACDKAALLTELESRPDAYAQWAAVLDIPAEAVPLYIESLEEQVLDTDTMVTNHGLHDGTAYARQSMLVAGTAVLVDPNFAERTSQTEGPSTSQDTTTSSPTPSTTVPQDQWQPVTRCKCGNPLLPAYAPATPTPTETTTTYPQGQTSTTAPYSTTSTRPTSTTSTSSSSTTSSTSTTSSSTTSTTQKSPGPSGQDSPD